MSARENTDRGPRGGWRWGWLKFAVSATLLGLVLHRFSVAGLRAELSQTSWLGLLLPFALIVLGNLLGAVQWHWLLRSAGVVPGFARVLRAYVIGLFFNNFTLGSVGGDVFKIWSVGRDEGAVGRVAGATVVDRMVGLGALCALALIAATVELTREPVPMEQALLVAGFSVVIMGAFALLLHPRYGERLAHRVEALPLGRWSGKLRRLLDNLRGFRAHPRVLNRAFAVSLVVQAARVAAHFCVGLAMGWPLHVTDLLKFFLVIPILGLVISLPISFGGWGVREWAGIALFAPLGHGGEEAVALLALTATLTLAASLVGAVALVWRTR